MEFLGWRPVVFTRGLVCFFAGLFGILLCLHVLLLRLFGLLVLLVILLLVLLLRLLQLFIAEKQILSDCHLSAH